MLHHHEKSRKGSSPSQSRDGRRQERCDSSSCYFAIAIFVTALSVFLMSPERQTEVLETLGIGLKQRALFALSILGMVFSTVLGVRTVFEEFSVRNG